MDVIDREKAVRAHHRLSARFSRHLAAWPITAALLCAAYAGYAISGLRAAAPVTGTVGGLPLRRPVSIFRDRRGVPHVRAHDEWGAFFGEGFAQGEDRLFQMDLIRRFAYGRLAEMLGPIQLQTDEQMRTFDIRGIARRQWRALPARDRADLRAFAQGVNAAARVQPLPIEFRLLLYRPEPWEPQDSLAVALAIALTVEDTPDNVIARDALWRGATPAQYARALPLSDPAFDVAADSARTRSGERPGIPALAFHPLTSGERGGSNAWAAGGSRERAGHALRANDPHLTPAVPGIWYAVEIRAPHLHVAGVTVPGLPGVALGHNERVAWAATNAMVSTISLFEPMRGSRYPGSLERFHVRFARDAVRYYYRSAHEFAVRLDNEHFVLERWAAYDDPHSAVSTIFALDRAADVRGALRALGAYAGPPQNFVVADTRGRVAYHLAGRIPNDPAWGRYVHGAQDVRRTFAPIAFDALPSVAPSRSAIVLSANNKMYGPGYRYRLSPMFAPPYRAFRIAELLRARRTYDVAYFERMQLDVVSPVDAAFAHAVAAYAVRHPGILAARTIRELRGWNGSYSPESHAASIEHELREAVESTAPSPYAPFAAIAGGSAGRTLEAVRGLGALRLPPWRASGETALLHPFGSIGFPFLNVPALPGDGDRYTIRVQTGAFAQSFRAVWRVGDWERGGLSLPVGESGEIGSAHYDDQRSAWISGALQPLAFDDAAVMRAARSCLRLQP